MRQSLRDQVEEEMEMNMTPMIDVVFLLIIFFLCIDFKVLEAKLPAYLPKDVGSHSTSVEPQEKLNIKIVCEYWGDPEQRRALTEQEVAAGKTPSYILNNHRVRWEVGPKRYRELPKLLEELKRVAADPSKMQLDPKTNERKLMGVVIEPGQETTYGDVATTLDAIHVAGFKDISFGGGLGARKKGS